MPSTPISSLSRPMRYRIRRFREGKCINCGAVRGEKYKRYCDQCGEKRRRADKKRRKAKFHTWKPGGRGRPPKNAQEIIARKKLCVTPPVNPEQGAENE